MPTRTVFRRDFPANATRLLLLVVLVAPLAACARREPTTHITVGDLDAFPPGSVTRMDLHGVFEDPDPAPLGSATPGAMTEIASAQVSPVPIYLVNAGDQGVFALYARDPYRGCLITWDEASQRFLDACHGSVYTMTGEWLSGPSDRGMDRFGVITKEDGSLVVDLTAFSFGAPHP